MLIRKAYCYRLYPNTEQERLFAVNFGQARFVYNHFLAERKAFYDAHQTEKKKGLNYEDNAAALKKLKRDPDHIWLKEGSSQVLQQALKDLDKAYQNFCAKRAKFCISQEHLEQNSYMSQMRLANSSGDSPGIGNP